MKNEVLIVPAILPDDFEEIKGKIALVKSEVSLVQIDICDGFFGQKRTWPFYSLNDLNIIKEEGFPFWKDVNVEIDLLLDYPTELLKTFLEVGAYSIVLHLESKGFEEAFSYFIDNFGLKGNRFSNLVLSISPKTENEKLTQFIEQADCLQIMGNDILGSQGKELDQKVFAKIEELKNLYPGIQLAVDIGVNSKTAKKLVDAGITKLVAGSTIFHSAGVTDGINELKLSIENA